MIDILQISSLVINIIGAYFLIESTIFQTVGAIAKKSALCFGNPATVQSEASQKINYIIGFALLTIGFSLQAIIFVVDKPYFFDEFLVVGLIGILAIILLRQISRVMVQCVEYKVAVVYYRDMARDDFEAAKEKDLDYIGNRCGVRRNLEEVDELYKNRIRGKFEKLVK